MKVEEVQKQFHKELKWLLAKYKAELTLEDFGWEYTRDYKMVVNFSYDESLFEENGTGIIPQLILGYSEDGN